MVVGPLVGMVGAALMSSPQAASAQRPSPGCPDGDSLDPQERQQRVDEAVQDAVDQFSAGHYTQALAALDAADCYEPRAAHDFIRGAIHKEQGQCRAAIVHFDAFLAADVPPADAAEARRLRDECRAALRPPKIERPCPGPAKPDRLGIGLAVGGGLMLGAGVGLVAGAHGLKRAAPRRSTLADHDRALRTARVLNPVGWAALGVGAAALISGVVRLVVVRKRRRRRLPPHCR